MPTAYINRMDHLTSYAQVVTDATKELCDLILSSYREKLNLICKSGECITYAMKYLNIYLLSCHNICTDIVSVSQTLCSIDFSFSVTMSFKFVVLSEMAHLSFYGL